MTMYEVIQPCHSTFNLFVKDNTNKRAQRALGRSPEEKVKGQGEAIILLKQNIGRELLDDAIHCIPNLKALGLVVSDKKIYENAF